MRIDEICEKYCLEDVCTVKLGKGDVVGMDGVFGRSSERGGCVDTQWLPSALGIAS